MKNNLTIDFIIVGNGIAACLLAHRLLCLNHSILLIGKDSPGMASPVSSGLINPVTGLRYVKTWNYENLVPVFTKFYSELENDYQCKFIFQQDMIIEFESIEEENNWLTRMADDSYKKYCKILNKVQSNIYQLDANKTYGLIEQIYRIDIPNIRLKILEDLKIKNIYKQEVFHYNEIEFNQDFVIYKNEIKCTKIIFCEGHKINDNPYFNYLPIAKLKGERLLMKNEHIENQILHSNYSIVPMNSEFWIGSNYTLKELSYQNTEAEIHTQTYFAKNKLIGTSELLNVDYGFRAASRDRRPIVGTHPEKEQLMVLNGLGTKGASLAPYCVELLCNTLQGKASIPNELNTERFVKKY